MGSSVSPSPSSPSKNIHKTKSTLEDTVTPHAKKGGQANGPISIGLLNTLLCLHSQPINHVVFMGSHRDTLS